MEEKEDTRVVSKGSSMKYEELTQIELMKKEVTELNKQYYESVIRIKELNEQNNMLEKRIRQLENTLYDYDNYRGH